MNVEISVVGLLLVFFWNVVVMYNLTEPKYSRAKTRAIWCGAMAALLLLSWVLVYTIGVDLTAPVLAVVAMIVIIAVLFITSSDNIPKKIFLVITYFNFFFLIVQGSFIIAEMVFDHETIPYQILSVIIRNLLYIILVPSYFKFLHPKFRAVRVRRNREWWFLNIITVLFTFVFITQAMVVNKMWKLPSDYLPVLISMAIQGAATCIVVFRTIVYMDKTAEASLMEQNTHFLTEQIERLVQAEEDARRLRHDIRHHLTNIYEYAKSGDCETIVRYLEEYDKLLTDAAVKSYCANRTVNNILSAYAGEAEKAGIEYICEVKTAAELPIKDTDIVAILANLLENALNGCVKSGKEKPSTEIFIREKNGKLVIVCNNHCPESLIIYDGLPKNKGIGISSIISSCEKYGGKINYTVKNGVCSVCAVLDI